MAILKCKMCGGTLELIPGASTAECEYCGSVQTVPAADDEKKLTLFTRAHRLRAACEFDKAAGVYESIVADFPDEAEAYWCLVLCKYGIEYVDDPATGRKVPTSHRSSFEGVLADSNFQLAQEYADVVARKVMRDEAKQIEEIRKGIIAVSANEDPYDIFICYKETGFDGKRSLDSVLAQDIYSALTKEGYRVFFARITLEDKLGTEYEPYIFAALNSAKIMLVVGTDYEHFNAVWVKNEWSRYLMLMAKDSSRHLIPCYKGIDAYDMPEEFARLQAQDLDKMGAIQDILRGVEKLLPKQDAPAPQATTPIAPIAQSAPIDNFLKRGQFALEDGNWNAARQHYNDALNLDAECAQAYLGLAMCDAQVTTLRALVLSDCTQDPNYRRGRKLANHDLLSQIKRFEEDLEDEKHKALLLEAKKAEEAAALRKQGSLLTTLFSAHCYHTVGLRSNGTVVATKYLKKEGDSNFDAYAGQCEVSDWSDIIAVCAGYKHTVGLKADGTVIVTEVTNGEDAGQSNVSHWDNIIAISAGDDFTVGLREDGTVVATGETFYGRCDVKDWTQITQISAGDYHTAGLKADGTVIAVGSNEKGQCNVTNWTNITSVSAGGDHTVGLKADGTVVATKFIGNPNHYCDQCEVEDWHDIVAVCAGQYDTVGLKADGTVVYAGDDNEIRKALASWKDIIAISSGLTHVVGLRADGTFLCCLNEDEDANEHGQANVDNWKLFDNLEELQQKREQLLQSGRQVMEQRRLEKEAEAEKIREEAELQRQRDEMLRRQKIDSLQRQKQALQNELSSLKGLFSGKRKKELELQIAAIDNQLKGL